MTKPLHILLVNNFTTICGIPKVVAALANEMDSRGHKVDIISQKPVPRPLYPFYKFGHMLNRLSLPPGKRAPMALGVEKLEEMFVINENIRIYPYSFSDSNQKIQKLRKSLMELNPDVCVCPLADGSQLVWAVTLMGSGIPYIYSERTSPQAMENDFWTRKGRLAAMSGADAIHLLQQSFASSIPDFLADRVTVIPNNVPVPQIKADIAGTKGKRKILLWLSRLFEEAKQCTLAIDAFSLIARRFPDWDLHIYGDGPDKNMVMTHAEASGFGNRIKFGGHADNPMEIFARAQAYCFSSRIEGMPNTLLEAMSCGLPCAAFRNCPGVADIIQDGFNGLLANEMTAKALGEKLAVLLGNAGLRQDIGLNAAKSMEKFSHKAIFDQWEDLLIRTAVKKGNSVMDSFYREPFASMARMSSRARQEWAMRDFGRPMPGSVEEVARFYSALALAMGKKLWIKLKAFGG